MYIKKNEPRISVVFIYVCVCIVHMYTCVFLYTCIHIDMHMIIYTLGKETTCAL